MVLPDMFLKYAHVLHELVLAPVMQRANQTLAVISLKIEKGDAGKRMRRRTSKAGGVPQEPICLEAT